MKAVFFEINEDDAHVVFETLKNVSGLELLSHKEKLSPENISLAKDADIVSVFVGSEMKREIIDELPNLKLVVTRSTGYDHIDVDYAREKGIKVSNIPAYGSHTVAEFAFALILSLSRKVYPAYNKLRDGSSFNVEEFQGFDLFGKTLGVIGMGKIGKNMINIARGFGMNTVAYDVKPDMKFAEDTCTKCVSLEEVLAGADIVSLHTILNESTRHLINKQNIYKMKKGAYLINTSRGEVVETEALLDAVTSGHLAGAGLDVLEAERQLMDDIQHRGVREDKFKDFKILYENHLLVSVPQVIVTPHIAFFTKEAEMEILNTAAKNILSFIEGSPQNVLQ
jgi:D-lactate dehydrogenase